MDATQIAWVAGFFDGEGTAYTARNGQGRCYLSLSVANTDREALERVQAVLGGRIYEHNEKGNRLGSKQLYTLKISDRGSVNRAVELLSPFLTKPKLAAIAAARELEASNPPPTPHSDRNWPRGPGSKPRKKKVGE